MTEEEKEAVKYFYNLRATIDESNMLFDEDINVKCGKEMIKQITTVLNLLEKKDRQIDEMAKELSKFDYSQYCNVTNCNYPPCNKEQCIKQYFERKVENGN